MEGQATAKGNAGNSTLADIQKKKLRLVVDIELQEYIFRLGLIHDTLAMGAIYRREMSAMLVAGFCIRCPRLFSRPSNGSAGLAWEFRRTERFK